MIATIIVGLCAAAFGVAIALGPLALCNWWDERGRRGTHTH